MEEPARPRSRLIWKYTAVVVTLVAAALITVGVTESFFNYQDSQRAVTSAEADKASSAAISIDQFMQEILADLGGLGQTVGDTADTDRLQSFRGLFGHQKSVNQLTYLDASGVEKVCAYSFEVDEADQIGGPNCGTDRSTSEEFIRARADKAFFGTVAFDERTSRPSMTVSVAEDAPGDGVIVAVVDLRSVTEALDRAQIGTAGYAYAVDARGELIAHPDKNLVLRHTNLADLPQVRAALVGVAGATAPPADVVTTGRDPNGTDVLSAFHRVERSGWWVFVEVPLSEAFAPIQAAIWRTVLLLVVFLAAGILRRPGATGPGADPGTRRRTRRPRCEDSRARGRQSPQVGIPGQHVARTTDTVERDQRLFAGPAQAAVR